MLPRSVNFLRDFLSQPRILIAPMYEPLGYPLYTRARTRRGWKGKVTEEFADARFASHAHWKWKLACDIMEYNNQEAWWLIYCCYRGKQNQEASVMNPDSHHFLLFFFFLPFVLRLASAQWVQIQFSWQQPLEKAILELELTGSVPARKSH